MPRLTAKRRLEIMSKALAHAEDLAATGIASVSLSDVGAHLGESVEVVRECLEPLEWVEVKVPGDIVDLVGLVRVEGGHLVVEEAWWRRVATLTPAEAARLYVKAAAAAEFGDAAMPLKTAMRKLRGIVGSVTVQDGDPPAIVNRLREAREAEEQVIVDIEGHDRTIVTSRARFEVIAVYRDDDVWRVTLSSVRGDPALGLTNGDAVTLPVERVLAVISAAADNDLNHPPPSVIDPEPGVDVTLEYPSDKDWMLDPYERSGRETVDPGRFRATVRLWGRGEVATLLLRLGPDAAVVEPAAFQGVRAAAARQILERYSDS